eukprot:m.147022 g.147022  ORF g.147022 m.147022 type:complete len:3132 (+) comp9701_c0_seq1:40-9435(+)
MSWFFKTLSSGKTPEPRAAPKAPAVQEDDPLPREASLRLSNFRNTYVEFEVAEAEREKIERLPALVQSYIHLLEVVDPKEVQRRITKEILRTFTLFLSRYFVQEVRRRAKEQSTASASSVLETFFTAPPHVGNLLIQGMMLLASDSAMVECMAEMAVPSTISKILYLFFDLPPRPTDAKDSQPPAREVLVQQLVRLFCRMLKCRCSFDELMKTRDLARMFSMLIMSCPKHNALMRRAMIEIIAVIFKGAMTSDIAAFLVAEHCISSSLSALENTADFSPKETTDIYLALFQCIQESTSVNAAILDELTSSRAYDFLQTYILDREATWLDTEHWPTLVRLLHGIGGLVACGSVVIQPTLVHPPSHAADFILPKSTTASAKNLSAFTIIHVLFQKSQTVALRSLIIEVVFKIFTSDPANYFILATFRTLGIFIDNVDGMPQATQVLVFKLLEYVVCTLNFVPTPELGCLCNKIRTCTLRGTALPIQTLIKLINFDAKYCDICREVGIFSAIIDVLQSLSDSDFLRELEGRLRADHTFQHEGLRFLMEALTLLLTDNSTNCALLRQTGGAVHLFKLVHSPVVRHSVLRIIMQLIVDKEAGKAREDLSTLLEVMQASKATAYDEKMDIMRTLMRLLSTDSRAKNFFREIGGFVYTLSTLVTLARDDGAAPLSQAEVSPKLQMVKALLELLAVALKDHLLNQETFRSERHYKMLCDGLRLSGLLEAPAVIANELFGYLFRFVTDAFNTGPFSKPETAHIMYPHIMRALAPLISTAIPETQAYCFEYLVKLVGRECNSQALASVGFCEALIQTFGDAFLLKEQQFHSAVLALLVAIGSQQLEPAELRLLLRLGSPGERKKLLSADLLKALVCMGTDSSQNYGASFIEFSFATKGYASLFLPSIARLPRPGVQNERTWPPQNGTSVCMWVRVDAFPAESMLPLTLLTIFSPTEPECVYLNMEIDGASKHLHVRTTESVTFPEHTFELGVWTHVGIVITPRSRLKASQITLYIDGRAASTKRISYPATGPLLAAAASEVQSLVCLRVGVCLRDRAASLLVWRLAGLYVIDDVLSMTAMNGIHKLGVTYASSLQGLPPDFFVKHEIPPPRQDLGTAPCPLVPEDRIWAALHARTAKLSVFEETLGGTSQSRVLARVHAREVDAKESALSGVCWTLRNAVLVGPVHAYLTGSARAFIPGSLGRTFEQVGGVAAALKLLSDTQSSETMALALRLQHLVARQSSRDLTRPLMLQLLNDTLTRRSHLINSDVLIILMGIVAPNNRIDDEPALKELILNFRIWQHTPIPITIELLDHSIRKGLLSRGIASREHNLQVLLSCGAVQQLLDVIHEDATRAELVPPLCGLLQDLLDFRCGPEEHSALERFLVLTFERTFSKLGLLRRETAGPLAELDKPQAVRVRNCVLHMMLSMGHSRSLQTTFGPDWLLRMLNPNADLRTAICSLRLLVNALADHTTGFVGKFRAFNGFKQLAECLAKRSSVEEVFGLAFAALFGVGEDEIVPGFVLTLPRLHELFSGKVLQPKNPEMVAVILDMLRSLMHASREESQSQGTTPRPVESSPRDRLAALQALAASVPTSPQSPTMDDKAVSEPSGSPAVSSSLSPPSALPSLGVPERRTSAPAPLAPTLTVLERKLADPKNPFSTAAQTKEPVKEPVKEAPKEAPKDARPSSIWKSQPWPTSTRAPAPPTKNPFLRSSISEQSPSASVPSSGSPDPFDTSGGDRAVEVPRVVLTYLEFVLKQKGSAMAAIFSAPQCLESLVALLFTDGDGGELRSDADSRYAQQHPCARLVLELLKHICLVNIDRDRDPKEKQDSFTAVIDAILDGPPPTPLTDLAEFQYDLISTLLKHLHALGILNNGDRYVRILTNLPALVMLLTDRVCGSDAPIRLDAIAACMQALLRPVIDDAGVLHAFVEKAFGRTLTSAVVESLFKALNRLYATMLARVAAGKVTGEQVGAAVAAATEALPTYLLGQANPDQTYALCLVYIALDAWRKPLSAAQKTAWRRFWTAMLQIKQRFFSGLTNRSFDPAGRSEEEIDREIDRMDLLKDQLQRAWHTYADRNAIMQQRTSKRIAKRPARADLIPANTRLQHAASKERLRLSRRKHQLADTAKYVTSEWNLLQADLHHERGLWGLELPGRLKKWMLDSIEGPARTRRRLKANPTFYDDYPGETAQAQGDPSDIHRKRKPVSKDSDLWLTYVQEQLQQPVTNFASLDTVQSPNTELTRDELQPSPSDASLLSVVSTRTPSRSSLDLESLGTRRSDVNVLAAVPEHDDAEEKKEDGTVYRLLLEPGDEDGQLEPAALVFGLDSSDGVVVIGKKNVYFLEGFGRSDTGALEQLAEATILDKYQPVIKWAYDEIKDIRAGRYLLQERAIEVFAAEGTNTLLVLKDRARRDAICERLSPLLTQDAVAPVPGMEAPRVERDFLGLSLSGLGVFGSRSVTQRWENGEITNFQYLMYLNTLAGRTYNDLNQYPVFPWVLADYESPDLDLDDPRTFRDLSKPMGAQTPARAEAFAQRYESWEDPLDEGTPAFHYGTHYSSAAIVAGFLVRLEPFAKHFLKLQGGFFDHPDRMFHSIAEAWSSASEKNNGDVKELIPEFFYLPEFLTNSNRFDYGLKQNGVPLDDVILPPWAKDDPNEFIRVHRQALESDFVSSHLHEWIDLIFGYRQQGDEAVKALNVFHHLTYEGAVDIDAITDPVTLRATISIINNFGQTPKQLFKKPHPPRKIAPRNTALLLSRSNALERLVCAAHPVREIFGPVGSVAAVGDKLFVASKDQVLLPPAWARMLEYSAPSNAVVEVFTEGEAPPLTAFESMHTGLITAMAAPTPRLLITGGTDCLVRVWALVPPTSAKLPTQSCTLKKTLHGHLGAVRHLAACVTYNILVSGGDDQTCIVWDLVRFKYIRQLGPYHAAVSAVCVNQLNGNIVVCAGDHITMYTINGAPLAAATRGVGSAALCCTLSELSEWAEDTVLVTGHRDGRVRIWYLGHERVAGKLTMVLVLAHTLMLPSTPGNGPENPAITSLSVSSDLRRLFTGDARGRVFAWCLPDASGRTNEHWLKDSAAPACMGLNCNVRFSFAERRHHCRNCGKVFCQACSANESEIPSLNISKPVRVCDLCYERLGHGLGASVA